MQKKDLCVLLGRNMQHTDVIRALAEAYDGIGDLENVLGKTRLAVALRRLHLPKDPPILMQDPAALGIRHYRNQYQEPSRKCYRTIREANVSKSKRCCVIPWRPIQYSREVVQWYTLCSHNPP